MVVTPKPASGKDAKKADDEEEEWKDIDLKCMDCDATFQHTVADQEFFHSKGFTDTPKRCRDCRWAKKQRNEGKDGGGKDGKGKGKGKGKDGKGKDGKGKGKGKDKGKGKGGGGVCYKFQAGNCHFTDCKFSHE